MVYLKTREEISIIKESADILGRVHGEISKVVKEGVTTQFLDKLAYEFINDNKAVPSFKGYDGFPATLCVSLNDQVVHGLPTNVPLKSGDILSVDCGVYYKGFHSDSAYTYPIGEINSLNKKLLSVTYDSLFKGIEAIVKGARIGDIANSVQRFVESNGFSVVRELVGHGVGRELHEEPQVPNYGKRGSGVKLIDGMVLAIEPMVNIGTKNVRKAKDGWSIHTADKKNSAHYEHTVAIIDGLPEILTTFKYIQNPING